MKQTMAEFILRHDSMIKKCAGYLVLVTNFKQMKKISILYYFPFWLMFFVSCKPDMELNNPKELSVDTYYKTVEQLEASIIPAYEAIIGKKQGGYARCYYFELLAPGDDFDHTFKWEPMYQDTYDTPTSDWLAANSWKDMWNGVYAANLALDRINNFEGEIDTDIKDRLLGQAYFLRGFFYMHLCMLYGETVPLITTPPVTNDDYYPGNSKAGEIYALIISDFQEAEKLLPKRSVFYADDENIGRATQGAAQAYLARAYLYRPILEKGQVAEFAKAQDELYKIIESKEYNLVDNFRSNSLGDENENNAESIFEVQMHNGPGWLGADFSDSWRWQEIGIFDGTGGAWWNLAPNQKTLHEFEPGDPRKYMTLWCEDGAYYTELDGNVTDWDYWMEHLASNKDLLGTRKYCPDNQISDFDDDINDRLMRYADVLLMYAECLNEAGDENEAKAYIDSVRSRANNVVPSEQDHLWYHSSPGTIPDVDGLLAKDTTINGIPMNSIKNIIQHERYVELCGEYVRYFDLLRWGMADSKWLQPLKDLGWTEKAMYYPFPQNELDNNSNLTGNAMNK
jgi:starch-binding outer membrane protein, SusD/RagB family